MRNIKLTIEYDGKEFNGWQKQPNKLNIQGNIERAIETITGFPFIFAWVSVTMPKSVILVAFTVFPL